MLNEQGTIVGNGEIMRLAALIGLLALSWPLLMPSVTADLLVPGTTYVSYQYRVTNLDEHPDYLIMATSEIWGCEYVTIINQSNPGFGGGYKLDGFVIVAQPAASFDPQAFWDNRTGYCASSSDLIRSDMALPVAFSVNKSIGLERAQVFLKVDPGRDGLAVTPTRVVYSYEDGEQEDLPVGEGQQIPAPGRAD
ncbi:MAG: hypothetical protein A4E45_01009 [Methanosaeta sp. PtaB.Bin039]|nr:MAG: hypothetical protein A4E45_01009 [Methanosaeta sp. PtaB.Bin039]